MVLVTDDAIASAQRALWESLRVATEPGGAATLAALRSGAYARTGRARRHRGQRREYDAVSPVVTLG